MRKSNSAARLLATCVMVTLIGSLWVMTPSAAAKDGDAPPGASNGAPARSSPLPGATVARRFQVEEHDWLPGHRGVDLAGATGQAVLAAADGTVRWTGRIDGVPGLSVQHADGTITTYQPVSALVSAGQSVRRGAQIGSLEPGHPGCTVEACLHWGVKSGDQYLDPLVWLDSAKQQQVRLLPLTAEPRRVPPANTPVGDLGDVAGGDIPLAGPITSPFGPRINPVTGAAEMHTGVDIGAACGVPVRANVAGVVTRVGWLGGYGLRVELTAGDVVWSYSHLSSIQVSPGERIPPGQTVGLVGTTGMSTGCHLHFEKFVGGRYVNPIS